MRGAGCATCYSICQIFAIQSQDQLPGFGDTYLEQDLIGADFCQIKGAGAGTGNAGSAVRTVLRETDIRTGCYRCSVVRRHQGIKIGVAQYAAGRSLRTNRAGFTNRPLRSGSAGFTGRSLGTGGTLRSGSAGFTGRPLWPDRAGNTCRPLGTDRPGNTRRTLRTGRTSDTGGALRANRAGFTGRALRANGPGNACRPLRTGGTCYTGGTLRTNRAGFTDRPLRTDRTGNALRPLRTNRPSDSGDTLRTGWASRTYRTLGAGRARWAICAAAMISLRAAILIWIVVLTYIIIELRAAISLIKTVVSVQNDPSSYLGLYCIICVST